VIYVGAVNISVAFLDTVSCMLDILSPVHNTSR